jgi:hypothetical protein
MNELGQRNRNNKGNNYIIDPVEHFEHSFPNELQIVMSRIRYYPDRNGISIHELEPRTAGNAFDGLVSPVWCLFPFFSSHSSTRVCTSSGSVRCIRPLVELPEVLWHLRAN